MKKMTTKEVSDFLSRPEMREVMAGSGSGSGSSDGRYKCPIEGCPPGHLNFLNLCNDEWGYTHGKFHDPLTHKNCVRPHQ